MRRSTRVLPENAPIARPGSHLRLPSNAASSRNEKDSPDHYAWLAYEWRNLLLLCAHCNRMKANLFPVEGPRVLPLTTWKEAVAAEEALLLDPCADEPDGLFMDRYSISTPPSWFLVALRMHEKTAGETKDRSSRAGNIPIFLTPSWRSDLRIFFCKLIATES